MRQIKYIFPLLLIINAGILNAQKIDPGPSSFHIGIEAGMPSSETYYVHQDRHGYIWFCTDRGVVKYDGFRLHLYNKSNGLPDEVVFKIFEDELGRIWFFLYNGTLAYYDHQERKIIPYKYNHILSQLNHGDYNSRKSFSVDKKNNVYYSGLYGFARIDRDGRVCKFHLEPVRELINIHNSWLITGAFVQGSGIPSIVKLTPKRGKPVYYDHRGPILKFDMIEVKGHRFLVVNDELFDLENPAKKAKFIGYTGIYNVDGELWLTTLTGAYRFKNPVAIDPAKPDGIYLKDQKISCVTKDAEGGYWFTTLDDGVKYVSCLEIVNWITDKDAIHDIKGIGNNLYYSSAFGYYNLKTGEKLLETRGGENVIGVWDNKLVLSNNIPFYINPKVTQYKWGMVGPQFQGWATDGDKFYTAYVVPYVIDKKTKTCESLLDITQIYNSKKYTAHYLKSLAIENGKLYTGSLTGLYRIENGRVKKCRFHPDFNRIRITDLKYHKDWGLIVATRGKGIVILRNEKIVRRIQRKDGLLSDQLNTLHVTEDGIIYAGTHKGVSKIVPVKRGKIEVFNLTELNGLSSSEVNAIFKNSDGVYVGTREGITLIPSSYKWTVPSQERQIRIQSVFTNGKQLTDFRDGMEFNASHKIIRFLLQTTNYRSLHKKAYKYRFRKTDPWSYGHNGELIMINPAFESYQLEIRYQNEYGGWSKTYVLTNFSVLLPFYSTWWFTGLIIILIVGGSFLLFRNRIRVIQHRNAMQTEIRKLEQKALLAQMNPHFIFNSLNSIQSFLIFNENELAERYLLKLSQLMRMTLNNSRESMISIEKEIEILQKYIELEQMRFKDRFVFGITTTLSKADLPKKIPPMLIQPFVENAIIHGFKNLSGEGKLFVNFLKIEDRFLHVEVVDNGLGYKNTLEKKDTEHKSFGTRITSERLDLFRQKYGGNFSYTIETLLNEKDESAGTIVRMTIPIIASE